MRKLLLVTGLAGMLAASNVMASMSATVTEAGGNQYSGGLFQAQTSDNGTFDTYCLSIVTTFVPGQQYYYNISSTIDMNGVPPAYAHITYGTAYMYDQFLKGNVNYGGGAVNADTIGNVQATIWYLQNELSGYQDPEGPDLTIPVETMLAQLAADGVTLAKAEANGNGAFGVKALNLYSSPDLTGVAQPQLVEVPEPTTMVAGAGALGLALLGIGRARRTSVVRIGG